MPSEDSSALLTGQNDTKGIGFTDPLTMLGNRSRFRDKVFQLVEERTSDPAPFTVGIVNLDGFRPINELFGDKAGDEILCQVAHRLEACMPSGAIVTRHGPDEFAFVLPMIFEEGNAEKIAELFRDLLSAPYDLGDRQARLSASFGLSIYPFGGDTFEQLEKNAETALYRSKRRGRGQVTVYSSRIVDDMNRATKLEQALRTAINNDEVDVFFQPIVDLSSNIIIGFEALARWTDDVLGYVPPSDFIKLAEERGFIDALSETLLRKAALSAIAWPSDIYLSFNLSSAQLVDPRTSINVLSIINRVGLEPRRLVLEITETAVMAEPTVALKIIRDLRALGIRIALDDFGTGHSSLGRLTEFDFDIVKIDRSFISKLISDPAMEHIVRAVVTMCNGLALNVVAEGIETKAEADVLKALKCNVVQGYFIGRPVDNQKTLQFIDGYRGEKRDDKVSS